VVKDDDGKYHYIPPDKYKLETFLEIKYDKNGHVKGQHYRKKKEQIYGLEKDKDGQHGLYE